MGINSLSHRHAQPDAITRPMGVTYRMPTLAEAEAETQSYSERDVDAPGGWRVFHDAPFKQIPSGALRWYADKHRTFMDLYPDHAAFHYRRWQSARLVLESRGLDT